MVFVCKQTDAQPNSKEKLATLMKCKVDEQTQKGVRRVKMNKGEGEKLYYGKIFEAKGQFV